MKTKIIATAAFMMSALAFSSCEKVIDVDLNASNPRTIIEANVTDQPGPYTVKLAKSVNFDEANVFPAITGATVTLSDDAGNSEILSETSPGIYMTSVFPQGVPGRTYSLLVTAEGKTYEATSKMLTAVPIDTLTIQQGFDGNPRIVVWFREPAGEENFYRFIEHLDGRDLNDIFVLDDRFRDGITFTQNLFLFNGEDSTMLHVGDTATIFLRSIDKGAYEYFRMLAEILGAGNQQQASPANPTSNISNNAMGYFSAYAVRSKSIVIQ